MIELLEIEKKFGEITALDNISVKIPERGVVGLLGPNGAGKTTLMRIMVGFYTLNHGKIVWNNKKADPKSMDYRQKIGYLPESNPLYGYMSVNEFLNFVGSLKNINNLVEEIAKVVYECGLESVVSQKIETLSKGYKQRVGMASAIMGDPELLILDEPTSGLDPNQIIEIRKLILKLSKGRAVVLSTHILPEAKEVCDRLLIINRGKIVLDEETKKVKNLEKKFISLTV